MGWLIFVTLLIIIMAILKINDKKEKQKLQEQQHHTEISRLRSELEEKNIKYKNLEYRIDSVFYENDDLKKANKELKQINKNILTENEKLEQELTSTIYKNNELKNINEELKQINKDILAENKKLAKYQNILDTQEEAKKIRETIKEKERKADEHIESAMMYYKETIQAAEFEKARLLNKTHEKLVQSISFINLAEALENKLNKYKNEFKYFVSPYTLLDELAQSYSYNEAGIQLKYAREHSRKMVEQNLAATCEYVEISRKRMAINFMIDSFDSKVEAILSKAKKDNYGVMEQKIKDAYYYVNDLGKPFKNAMITPEYLSTKLNELKWVCRVQLLLQQIKDEEYAKKEKMREEIKAQRERDKVILKTQKEIISIQESREALKKQIQEANAKERELLLNKLREMEEKLKELTNLNTRAVSMAEMVTEGNIYVISNIGSFGENIFKIGMTRRLIPEERIHELSNASVPFPFDIHAIIHSENARELEKNLHKVFNMRRVNMVNLRKEFFELTSSEIREELEKQNIEVEWTELAKAEQYRESLRRKEAVKHGDLTNESLDDLWKRYSIKDTDIDIDDE